MKHILVTGSYNGQDSLGDECLLESVIQRLQKHAPSASITLQTEAVCSQAVQRFLNERGVHTSLGLQGLSWKMVGRLQRLRLPAGLQTAASNRMIDVGSKLKYPSIRSVFDEFDKADLFFVFGGTQFSGQWYQLNAPFYFDSAKHIRSQGGRVVFGPQQYGPLSAKEKHELRARIRELSIEWRTRNAADVELLGAASTDDHRLLYDEVYSNLDLFPSSPPTQEKKYILVNLRSTTFDTDSALADGLYDKFCAFILNIQKTLDLPIVFFAVSDATFSDDMRPFHLLRESMPDPTLFSSVGRVPTGHALVDLAGHAAVTISMSFHGCILCGIGGSPFVPVTEGDYYDYKYNDFDKYAGNQDLPVISLSNIEPEDDRDRVISYLGRFDVEIANSTRTVADQMMDDFYSEVVSLSRAETA